MFSSSLYRQSLRYIASPSENRTPPSSIDSSRAANDRSWAISFEGKDKFSKLCVLRERLSRSSDHLETRVVPNEVLFDLLHKLLSIMEALCSELSGRRLLVPEIDAIFYILRRDMPEDSWEPSNSYQYS